MERLRRYLPYIVGVIVIAGAGAAYYVGKRSPSSNVLLNAPKEIVETAAEPDVEVKKVRREFSELDATYRFSAELPHDWVIKYVAATDAIAISHSKEAAKDLDEASIFIRNFSASSFLTLSTVDLLSKENVTINSHAAVRYEVEKKDGVADFANQPSWRSSKHKLVDIRYAPTGTTAFFVFAYKPDLREELFNDFINSLSFHNDRSSIVAPLNKVSERVSKKSFGTKVSPENSPVMPERFSGYHTGWDFEVFEDELTKNIAVKAICGGPLQSKATASGYGGYAVQRCEIAGQVFTVVYGHLRLNSVTASIGSYLAPGEKIGLLGSNKSSETDGERKHLHLSLSKGPGTDIRGYVSTTAALSGWIDPDEYL
jgi:hypothetical protein